MPADGGASGSARPDGGPVAAGAEPIGPFQWGLLAVAVVLATASLVVGLSPMTRSFPSMRHPTSGPVVVDCGSPLHTVTDLHVVTERTAMNPCAGVGNDRRRLAVLGLITAALLALAPLTALRRRPREPSRGGVVRRIDQFGFALLAGLVLVWSVPMLVVLNLGVRTYYGGAGLPPHGWAKIAMSVAILVSCLAATLLVRGVVLRRRPDLGRSARHLLALGAVSVAVLGATVATWTTFEAVDDANCHQGCDR